MYLSYFLNYHVDIFEPEKLQHAHTDCQQPEFVCGTQRSKYLFESHTKTSCLEHCANDINANNSFDDDRHSFSWMLHAKQTTKHQDDEGVNISENTSDQGKLEKERSLFIGQIPKDLQNVENSVEILMANLLYRFDFVPPKLGYVQRLKFAMDAHAIMHL